MAETRIDHVIHNEKRSLAVNLFVGLILAAVGATLYINVVAWGL